MKTRKTAHFLHVLPRLAPVVSVICAATLQGQQQTPAPIEKLAAPAPDDRSRAVDQARQTRLDPRQNSPEFKQAAAIFLDKCSACHGEKGAGDGTWHNDFHPHPANLSLVNDSPSMLRSIVVNGVAGTMMPSFPDLDNATLESILLYLSLQPRDLSAQWDHPWALESALGKKIEEKELKEGRQLFMGQCTGCHGNEGEGNGPMAKLETLWPKPANLKARSSDLGRIYFVITYGRVGTFMAPQNDKIPDLARWRLAQFVESLYDPNARAELQVPKQAIPTLHNVYLREDISIVQHGKDRLDLWCAPCHGSEGRGSFLAPRLIDRVWKYADGTDTAVFTIIEEGIPAKLMPSFKKLSEDERWQIITFFRYKGGLPDPLAGLGKPASNRQIAEDKR